MENSNLGLYHESIRVLNIAMEGWECRLSVRQVYGQTLVALQSGMVVKFSTKSVR